MSASEVLVEARGVWRRYRLTDERNRMTLRASLASGLRGLRRDWFWALSDVDLTLHRGQAIAVIGSNGAGKSTLLRLAGGIGRPDRGTLRVHGRVGALLELGHEFHPDLTGRQNAEVAAVVAGLTRAEFRARFPDIVEFSGLHGFIDQPLHAYSDGMRARLAFSVAIHVDPDALLVDEVLAVGDAAFQRRSVDRIESMLARGVGVLFVSHDPSLVRAVCDHAIWLSGGTVRAAGPAERVVNDYLDATTDSAAPPPVGTGGDSPLEQVAVLDVWGVPATGIRAGDGLVVEASVRVPETHLALQLSVKIRGQGTVPAVDTSTIVDARDHEVRLVFERLDLAPGDHEVTVSIWDREWTELLAGTRTPLAVSGDGPDRAALAPPHEWTKGPRRPG